MSDEIRSNFVLFLTYLTHYQRDIPIECIREYVETSPYQKNTIKSSDINDKVKLNILSSPYAIKAQLFTDFYQYYMLQYKFYSGKNFNKITNMFDDIQLRDAENLYNNDLFLVSMLDSLLYVYNSDVFERILLSKNLTSVDKEYLSDVNPFFKEDNSEYDIPINLDTVERILLNEREHIESVGQLKILYNDCAKFLFDLHAINKEECRQFIIDLISQGTSIICCRNENEDTIKIDRFIFNQENLEMMLTEYYEYNFKKLSYKNGENNGL